MGFGTLEKEFCDTVGGFPPYDYTRLEALLYAGADINAFNEYNETLLSETILNDFSNDENGPALLEYIRFMLNHGFDVTMNNGAHGGETLINLVYVACNPYMVEAARMLLNAGADSAYVDDHEDVRDWYLTKSGDEAVNYNDYEASAVYATIAEMMWLQQHHRDFNTVQMYTAAIGKTVENIYICDDRWNPASFHSAAESPIDATPALIFTGSVILTCGSLPLSVSHSLDIMVNPNDIAENKVSLHETFADVIGETIEQIQLYRRVVQASPDSSYTEPVIILTLSHNKSISFNSTYSGGDDCTCSISLRIAENE